jgi:hypothetical protein
MKELDLFLEVLAEVVLKNGIFLTKKCTIPTKIAAIKKTSLEVYFKSNSADPALVSNVVITEKITTPEEGKEVEYKLLKETYKNLILKYGRSI